MSCFTQLDTITILASNWPKINILASNWPKINILASNWPKITILASNWPKITILASNWPKINVLASNWPKINVLGLWLVAECQSESCVSPLYSTLPSWSGHHSRSMTLSPCWTLIPSSWPQDQTGTTSISDNTCQKSSPWPPYQYWCTLTLWGWGNDCLSSLIRWQTLLFLLEIICLKTQNPIEHIE